MAPIEPYLVTMDTTIRATMSCIDKNGKGLAVVVDDRRQLLGTISDGDIRRAILRGTDLDQPVRILIEVREATGASRAVTAPSGTTEADLLRLMNSSDLRQLPILDADGKIVDIAFLSDLAREFELPMTAVVMAGGFGSRLRPLTDNTPKPMLHIGNRPILERTIEQLKKTGISRVNLTTHYKAEAISDYFGDGQDFGVNINYVHEDQPLGTAGALGLLGEMNEPLLVINGDILTQVDFRAMLSFHRENHSCLTVGVRQYDIQVPYGVMECEGAKILGVSEKPKMQFLVNAGIYLLEPSVRKHIPPGKKFDMTDLIHTLIAQQIQVVSFPIVEYWLDIGQYPDYEKAQSDIQSGRLNP